MKQKRYAKFQKQLLPILEKRFRDNESEVNRHLKEASTPAAQTLITVIRQWEFASRNIALARLLSCDQWTDKGTMVLERDCKGKPYPLKVPLAMAWDWYVYGDLHEQVVPDYGFAGRIKNIPANVTKDWAEQIKELFHDINRMSLATFKTIILGKCVKSYGVSNPHAFTWWDRQVSEFKDAQKAIDAFVVTRKGWEYLTTENLQNPKHAEEISKVLTDILARADELVEPSQKAIEKRDRELYIRQDATRARNDIKTLTSFFKKYGIDNKSAARALAQLSRVINDAESQTLTNA